MKRLGKNKLTLFRQALMSSTSLRNRPFHVVDETRTAAKCTENKKSTCKAPCFIVKYANL